MGEVAERPTTWTALGAPFMRTERLDPVERAQRVVAPLLVTPATDPPDAGFAPAIVRALLTYGGVVRGRDEVELMTSLAPSGIVDWPVRTVRPVAGGELRWDDFGATLVLGSRRVRLVGTRWEGGDAVAAGEGPSVQLLLCDAMTPVAVGALGAILPLETREQWRRRGAQELAAALALAGV